MASCASRSPPLQFKARNYVSEDIRGRKISKSSLSTSLILNGADRERSLSAILGDTCNPSRIAAAAEGSDLLIHEATSSNKEAAMAVSRGHSSAGKSNTVL